MNPSKRQRLNDEYLEEIEEKNDQEQEVLNEEKEEIQLQPQTEQRISQNDNQEEDEERRNSLQLYLICEGWEFEEEAYYLFNTNIQQMQPEQTEEDLLVRENYFEYIESHFEYITSDIRNFARMLPFPSSLVNMLPVIWLRTNLEAITEELSFFADSDDDDFN